MEPIELKAWVESVAGVDVASIEPVGYGSSNLTSFVTLADGREWVARVDTGHGPTAGTELDLQRQAGFLDALANHDVRSPRLVTLNDGATTMLMERAPGTHELPAPGSSERDAVLDDYMDALAQLHNLDIGAFDLPGIGRPTVPEDHARNELAIWRRVYEARRQRRHPIVDFSFALLHELAPPAVQRTVVCHGDVGPGNFLHADGGVTALVDWEFAHIGDPMDDLAWWVFRGHDMAGDVGDLRAQLQRWARTTGLTPDPNAIEYYRAFVMLRWLVSAIATVETGGPAIDRSVHNRLIPLMGALLPQSLSRLVGVTLDDSPPVADEQLLGMTPILNTMHGDLIEVVLPAIDDPMAQERARSITAYLGHLGAVEQFGVAVTAANARDLTELLGSDVAAGSEEVIADTFAALARTNPVSALRTLAAIGDRTILLWPEVAARPNVGLVSIPS